MTKGIFLVAFGDVCYGRAAFNLAVSIKYYDPDIQICLLHDTGAVSEKARIDMDFFDIKIPIENTADIKNPATIKANIYNQLPFDYNLYLDVDALALQSCKPLFDRLIASEKPYAVYVYELYDENSLNEMPMMYWASRADIWSHYNFNGHKLPATQSSIQFIKKCPESEKIFQQLQENIKNPIPIGGSITNQMQKDIQEGKPIGQLLHSWGGRQPDELYLNVALAQLGLNPHIGDDAIFFANNYSKLAKKVIKEKYTILSIYGGKGFTRPQYKDWYDALNFTYFRHFKMGYQHKIHIVLQNKHADKRSGIVTKKTKTTIGKINSRIN